MVTASSLDPRKSPWKRGDLCTLGFEKNGFVLNHAPEYLEVRWMNDGGIERIPAYAIDDLLRVGHADSLGPDGRNTNLECLQKLETLDFLQHGLEERIKAIKSEKEKQVLDHLTRRIFSEGKCKWDSFHTVQLTMLIAAPENVGLAFRIRERIHRIFCPVE
ncbi:MAG: hypothetical protein ABR907_02750 [Terracidiphilus sp.]|jgi:hypothetical protein